MSALLALDENRFKAVVGWRQHAGGLVNGTWRPEREKGNHLMVIFGRRDSDEPLHTPLAVSVNHNPEDPADDLMVKATTLWRLPQGTRVLGLYDLEAPYDHLRVVIVTSQPMTCEQTELLYAVLRGQINDGLPRELMYEPAP